MEKHFLFTPMVYHVTEATLLTPDLSSAAIIHIQGILSVTGRMAVNVDFLIGTIIIAVDCRVKK
jgi:hypothetical protein